VAHLLETLDVEKASLLGYSMGANVALQLALRHPDKVERLVVVSPSASDTGLAPGHEDMVRHLSPEMFTGTPVVADYERLSPRPDFPALVEKIKQIELTSYDWRADLSRIKSPVLIVGGDADVVTLGHLASMHAAMGGVAHGDINGPSQTQLMVLPATTHMGVIADPAKLQAVIAAATAFLAPPSQK
ncbi:alpha/beta fold hydrolase, partial [Rhizobiaceae sp. 2RAB30]